MTFSITTLGIMTLSIMTFGIMALNIDILSVVMMSVIMLSVVKKPASKLHLSALLQRLVDKTVQKTIFAPMDSILNLSTQTLF